MYEVTLWPVLAAGVASIVIGFVWYHPKVFGSKWMQLANIPPQAAEEGKKKMPLMAFIGFLASMLVAYVMNHFGIAWGVFDWIGGIELAFWIWLGFMAPVMLGAVLWEGKSVKLFAINAGYWFVSLVVMALILVWGSGTVAY